MSFVLFRTPSRVVAKWGSGGVCPNEASPSGSITATMARWTDNLLILLHNCHVYCNLAIGWLTVHGRLLTDGIDAVLRPVLRRVSTEWPAGGVRLGTAARTSSIMAYVVWRVLMKQYSKVRLGIQKNPSVDDE
uniref:Uncharacterized protein n=1 Tax=Anopheles albimanus TaxID=7167 RepID=A0A182FI02_ANOAL